LTKRIGPHTFEDMKDAVVTVRLRSVTRRQLQSLARREGRSLSAQIERLVEAGLTRADPGDRAAGRKPPTLAGILGATAAPSMQEFRSVRRLLSRSLIRSR
jgi:hypothetical protein